VVWNPAQDLCKRLTDMPDDGWRHMLCVEAAQVLTPITLPAGGRWTGWQRLQVRNT
jgi:glucose-6-phosphate 1-epimerase